MKTSFPRILFTIATLAMAGTPLRAQTAADSVRLRYTPADVHFMTGMIGHHAQAILIAGWAPTHGASPSIVALCERIVSGQHDEIVLMQRWLRDRHEAVPAGDTMSARMGGMDHSMAGMDHSGMDMMPGMLSPGQLAELDSARGPEFDRLFLKDMIQHHNGAIVMVNSLFGSQGAGEEEVIFRFASDVYADQTTEIDRMQKMLAGILFQGRTQ
ncbi:MAG: DUF305 domain-containing protein [Gemmatimonadota bacterium]